MREAIANRQRGTRKTQKPEDYAHASILHRRKSIKFGLQMDGHGQGRH